MAADKSNPSRKARGAQSRSCSPKRPVPVGRYGRCMPLLNKRHIGTGIGSPKNTVSQHEIPKKKDIKTCSKVASSKIQCTKMWTGLTPKVPPSPTKCLTNVSEARVQLVGRPRKQQGSSPQVRSCPAPLWPHLHYQLRNLVVQIVQASLEGFGKAIEQIRDVVLPTSKQHPI